MRRASDILDIVNFKSPPTTPTTNKNIGTAKFTLPPQSFILEQLSTIPSLNLPIYICANNHYVDTPDLKNRCPTCRSKVLIPCEFLEKLIRKSTFKCPYNNCDEVKDGATFNAHVQRLCYYRPLVCPYCNESISFEKYFEHLIREHELPGNNDDTDPKLVIPIHINFQKYGMYYKKWNGKTFLIRTYSGPNEGAYFWIEYYGAKGEEGDFSGSVQLISDGPHRTTIRFPISPIRSELDSLSRTKAYAHISRNSLLNYLDGSYKVNVSVYVQNSFSPVDIILEEDSNC